MWLIDFLFGKSKRKKQQAEAARLERGRQRREAQEIARKREEQLKEKLLAAKKDSRLSKNMDAESKKVNFEDQPDSSKVVRAKLFGSNGYVMPDKYVHDKYQSSAIKLGNGHHLVLAPPGCGKTDILAERIAYAISEGVKMGDMLCLTFTNRAARGMKERIEQRLQSPGQNTLFVGNIHRFCSQFLYDNGIVSQACAIIDDVETESILKNIRGINEDAELPYDRRDDVMDIYKTQHQIQQLRNKHPQDLLIHPDASASMRDVEKYERYKEENDLIDFDDILILAYDYMRQHPDSYKHYKWIQVDEVQDLNRLQLAIVDLLTERADDATVVYLGDEQQAIYSFMGAKLTTLDYLKEKCGGRVQRLYNNYRSPKYLLDVYNKYAEEVLGVDPSLLPQSIRENPKPNGALGFIEGTNNGKETSNVIAKAMDLIKEDGRTAILVNSNKLADDISEALGDTPHFKVSGKDLFQTQLVKAGFAHLSALANEQNVNAWAHILKAFKIFGTLWESRQFMKEMFECALLPSDFLLYEGDDSYMQDFVSVYESGITKNGHERHDVVIFDTETTGLNVFEDDIVQIAAIKLRNGKITGKFDIILHTDKTIPAYLGNLKNPLVDEYAQRSHANRKDGLNQFLDFAGSSWLIGHNVEYDYHILDYNLRRELGVTLDINAARVTDRMETALELRPLLSHFDTLKMMRMVEPRLRSYKLKDLLSILHLEGENSHLASDDIMATKSVADYIFGKLKPMLAKQSDFKLKYAKQLEQLAQRYGQIYDGARLRLYDRLDKSLTAPMVDEFKIITDELVANKYVQKNDNTHYVADFLQKCVIDTEKSPSLYEELQNYVIDLYTYKEADLCGAVDKKGNPIINERLYVSTVHKAKGLEFENVIVMAVNDGIYPFYKNKQAKEDAQKEYWYATSAEHKAKAKLAEEEADKMIKEDARKLYVGMSRAMKRLYLAFHKRNQGISQWGNWYDWPCPPSPFIKSIQAFFN